MRAFTFVGNIIRSFSDRFGDDVEKHCGRHTCKCCYRRRFIGFAICLNHPHNFVLP